MTHSKEKENLIGTTPMEAQTLGLLIKDIKSTVLNKLSELKETMDSKL